MTPAERVIAALSASGLSVRENGSRKWEAQCPAHDDRNASLSIDVGDDERALLCCHAGCATDAMVAALGLEMRDLFADDRPATTNGHRKIVASYDYLDESCGLLYQVIRFEPKSFRQRRPDGNGGWQWNLNGTRRVLYRLPHVIEAVAADRRVWIVEGEKDVHALEAAGEVATCNAGGAGKWRREYAEVLRGAPLVMVIADCDGPGRKHAAAVAASLEGIAAQVRVGEPAAGKDVHDHLAAGLGLTDFKPVSLPPPDSTEQT
jgi:putative DNA primase/helicase